MVWKSGVKECQTSWLGGSQPWAEVGQDLQGTFKSWEGRPAEKWSTSKTKFWSYHEGCHASGAKSSQNKCVRADVTLTLKMIVSKRQLQIKSFVLGLKPNSITGKKASMDEHLRRIQTNERLSLEKKCHNFHVLCMIWSQVQVKCTE